MGRVSMQSMAHALTHSVADTDADADTTAAAAAAAADQITAPTTGRKSPLRQAAI